MTKEQFMEFFRIREEAGKVNVTDLFNLANRTLLYGYDLDRFTFHLYIKNTWFYLIYYNHQNEVFFNRSIVNVNELPLEKCIPDKRLYPESCDYEFSTVLKQKGLSLPFTTYDPARAERLSNQLYHGIVLEEV